MLSCFTGGFPPNPAGEFEVCEGITAAVGAGTGRWETQFLITRVIKSAALKRRSPTPTAIQAFLGIRFRLNGWGVTLTFSGGRALAAD